MRKINYILSMALLVASISASAVNVYADTINNINSRAIITDSVVIDKGDSVGTLLLEDIFEEVNLNRTGNITITLSDTEDSRDKGNVKFGLSKVADIIDGEYNVLEKYKKAEVDLNNIKTSTDLELAANLFKDIVTTDNILTTDRSGKCNIDNLDIGVYLIFATDTAGYENITPFLVSIPSWNEADKSMAYDIKVIPKHTKIIEKEKSKVPVMGYSSNAFLYLGIGSCLLVGSSILFFGVGKNKKK